MKKIKKISLVALPTLSLIAGATCSLVSCNSKNISVKLIDSAAVRLTNSQIHQGKEFTTKIFPIDSPNSKSHIGINDILLFSKGEQLSNGPKGDGDYSISYYDDKYGMHIGAELVVYNPKNTIYIYADTSDIESDITHNKYNSVNLYKDSSENIVFDYNNKITPTDKRFHRIDLYPTSDEDKHTWNTNFKIAIGDSDVIELDDNTKTFNVPVGLREDATIDNDWSCELNAKIHYWLKDASGAQVDHECIVSGIPFTYHNEEKQKVKHVTMDSKDAEAYFNSEDDSYTYKLTINEDEMPFQQRVNVKLLHVGGESAEVAGKIYIDKSLYPIYYDQDGKMSIDVSVKYLENDATQAFDDYAEFQFEVSYINSDYQFVKEIVSSGDATHNSITLRHPKILKTYSNSNRLSYNLYEPTYFEFTSSNLEVLEERHPVYSIYDVDEHGDPDISQDSQWFKIDKEKCNVEYSIDGKVIVRFAVVPSHPELDEMKNPHKFVIKLEIDGEGSKKETIYWFNKDKPEQMDEYSPTLSLSGVNAYPFSDNYIDFDRDNGIVKGLSDMGISWLSNEENLEKCNALVIWPQLQIGADEDYNIPVTQIANNAFKATTKSGKAINEWAKKRVERNLPAPELIFAFAENQPNEQGPNDWKLESIGVSAFEGQRYITGNIVIPDSVTVISDYAFKDCSRDKEGKGVGLSGLSFGYNTINIKGDGQPEFVSYSKLSYIGKQAFANSAQVSYSQLKGNLILPNTVSSIGSNAFKNAGFDGVLHFPDSYDWSNQFAGIFEGCENLKGVVEQDFYPPAIVGTDYPTNCLPKAMFKNCSSFTGTYTFNSSDKKWSPTNKFVINQSIIKIGDDALNGTAIQDLEVTMTWLPDMYDEEKKEWKNFETTTVGSGAFNNMRQLRSISIWRKKAKQGWTPASLDDTHIHSRDWNKNNFVNAGVDVPDGKDKVYYISDCQSMECPRLTPLDAEEFKNRFVTGHDDKLGSFESR